MKRPYYVQPYLIVVSVALIAMAFTSRRYDRNVFLFEMILAVIVAIFIIVFNLRFRKYVDRIVRDAVKGIKGVNHTYLEKFSVPVAVVGKSGAVIWYNTKFRKKLSNNMECSGEPISRFIQGTTLQELIEASGTDVEFGNRRYTVIATEVSGGVVLYFMDDTELKRTAELYNDSRPAVVTVVLDNREDFDSSSADDELNHALYTLESVLKKWASSCSGIYIKNSAGRYKIIIDEKNLQNVIDSKFKILEEIREIKILDGSTATTVSMGIGRRAATFKECEQWSLQALDLALGRGGDQAAIKTNDEYEFYGGVSRSVEVREKVKARVIAKALCEKIQLSENVFIMGHQNSDLDAVGSAIGMWSVISKTFENETHIVINTETSLADVFLDNFVRKGNKNVFISPEEAKKRVTDNTLLIVVDTHSPTFVEDPELYSMCKNVVVIDHHRMMVNHISNASVFFHEPFASSASEMVTELIQYISDDVINRDEAEALLAGIMLDTKNFVLRTGVRTFEAAAYLKRRGADTVEVKRLFADSIDTYKTKSQLVSEAEIYNSSAIACTDEKMNKDKDIRLTAAQAADELLTIQDVQASYVVYKQGDDMCISARSLGDLNVQLVMEKLGGGGHQTMAGANLGGISRAEARERLVDAICEVIADGTADNAFVKRRNL